MPFMHLMRTQQRHHRHRLYLTAGLAFSAAVAAAPARGADEPVLVNGSLVYPEGAAIPRSMTAVESAYIETRPLESMRGMTPQPAGPISCPPEYAPMQGVLFAWEGGSALTNILGRMATHITTTGAADVYIMCDTSAEATSAFNYINGLTSPQANMSRVFTFVVTTDTVWIRDYGPRFIYEGSVRAIVDHTYNRPRPQDDLQPFFWATAKHHPLYEIPLVHGGGNFHLSGLAASFATELIENENPSLTAQQIHDHWMDYQALDTSIEIAFPQYIDFTQHIDMWTEVYADQKIAISQWATSPPVNAGDPDPRVICDDAAAAFQGAGWTVIRTPAFFSNSNHYTYTNVVICNNLVIVPSYTNLTVSPSNAGALSTWQAAMPGKTCVQVSGEPMISLAGVFHCIMMHVPAPLGGVNPTVYLRSPRGPESLDPGTNVDIRWSSDDDFGVSNVDILLSIDGGATFPTVIASATPDDGLFTWMVPSTYTTEGRIRVLARDAALNTGSDESAGDLFINAPPPVCLGDANGDDVVNFGDIVETLANWGASGAPSIPGDTNGDGLVNFDDVTATLANWGATCP